MSKQKPAGRKWGLTPKQRVFVDEYLVDFNGTQAAIRAGYSQRTAQEIASVLLSKAIIRKPIEDALRQRAQRLELSVDRVVAGIAEIAFSPGGPSDRDRLRALELLGRHLGIFVERHELSGPGGGPIPISTRRPLTIEELEQVAAGAPTMADEPGEDLDAGGAKIESAVAVKKSEMQLFPVKQTARACRRAFHKGTTGT